MEWWHPIPLPRRFAAARRSRLVGRQAELAEFETAWSRVEDGAGQVVLIGGEPGAGKTRLAVEVAGLLHDHDMAVLIAAAGRDAALPYEPVVDLLDHLFAHVDCCLDDGSSEQGVRECPLLTGAPYDLAQLSPHATRHLPGPIAAPPGEARRDMFDAVAMVLRRVSEQRPLAIVVDDLQWATPPTLALIEHVATASVDARVLLVATLRTRAPEPSRELRDHLAAIHRLDGVHRLDLSGLDTDAVAQFVVDRAGTPASEAKAAATILHDRTGGNPFFLREVWIDLERRGGLGALRDDLEIPVSIGDAITSRMSGMRSEASETIYLAAVLGHSFDLATLLRAADADQSQVVDALDAATSAGLLEPVDDRSGRYGFVHALTRQVLLDALPAGRLRVLHADAATALDRGPANPPETVPRLAHHYLQAQPLGYREQAYHYAVLAARQAAHGLAYEDAARWFERAAALPGTPLENVIEASFGEALNRSRAGDFAHARMIYDRLTSMPDPLVRLRAAMGFEDTNWRPGLVDTRAAKLLSDAISDCDLPEDDLRTIGALASLGRAYAFTGQHERADSLGDRAITLARDRGDRDTIVHALRAGLWHGLGPERARRQLERVDELSTLALESDDHDSLAVAAHFGALASYLTGDPAGLERYTRQEQAAAMSGRQPFMEYTALCLLQNQAYRRGEFSEAGRLADAALRIGEFDSASTEGPHSVQLFMIRRETGGLDAVRSMLTGHEAFAGRWLPGLLALYAELGLTDGAHRTLHTLLARDLDARVSDARFPIELAFMADAAADLADADAMRTLGPFLSRYRGGNIVAGQFVAAFGSADRYLARFAELAGDRAEADRLFASALIMDRRMGSLVHVAETLAHHALAVRRRGNDPARADRLEREARDIAGPIGQLRILRWLESAAIRPCGLTERELEVLGLLAAGLSNRVIGERLFISQNTVANHVRSILMKTGAANRTQAARYATDHDLA